MLKNKKVTLLISGGIAAYKIPELVSSLVKHEADVTCVLTESAEKFVSPLVLATLSKKKVYTDDDFFDHGSSPGKVVHIALAQETDLVVLAPATANSIAKFSRGIGDNLVTSILLATHKPVIVFPSMNDIMYGNTVTQGNMDRLVKEGAVVIRPDSGFLACGSTGAGRLPDIPVVLEHIRYMLYDKKELKGKKVLVNAGGTKERIDSARCISNYSSGKMGISLAKEAFYRGALVTLVIAGNSGLRMPYINVISAETADVMYGYMRKEAENADIAVFAAAVSDFRPESPIGGKIRKTDEIHIKFIENTDIAKELGKTKGNRVHIGFCACTDELKQTAVSKLKDKNFDIIFANDISDERQVFGSDNNSGFLINRSGGIAEIPLGSKDEIAAVIFDEACKFINERR